MAGNLTAMIAAAFSGSAAPPVTSDPYFEYTTLLLPGNGTNGAQNNTFLDGSTNNFTITRNGNTTQGTFSPFSQTGWGNYFNGSSGNLTVPYNSDFDYGSGDFTIEFWMYPTATGDRGILIQSNNYSTYGPIWIRYTSGTINIFATTANSAWNLFNNTVITGTIPLNTWTHIAITRTSAGVWTSYVNGTSAWTATAAGSLYVNSNSTNIGTVTSDTSFVFSGYLSNLRIVKGIVVYTGNFTPPTSALTSTQSSGTNIAAITGTETSLLTCQSNRFIDNSSNTFTVTPNGSPTVVAFSPFNPTASWSAATYGGSGYFDGTGDYLSAPSNAAFDFAAGDFTIEAFVYPTTASQLAFVARTETAGFVGFICSTTNFLASTTGSSWDVSITFTNALTANAWNHIAVVRNGNVYTAYKNGDANGTTTVSGTILSGSAALVVGRRSGQTDFSGYMSSLRLVKGTPVYTGAFTPPSLAPLTTAGSTSAAAYPSTTNVNTSFASSATSLLLNYTNAGIYDATSKNDLETVGNAQISTTQSKWGGSSMYFDGTGDYLNSYSNLIQTPRNLDFTIEAWLYNLGFSGSQNGRGWFSIYQASNLGYRLLLRLTTGSNNLNMYAQVPGTVLLNNTSSSEITPNSWVHVAFVRNSLTFRLYINGSLDTTINGVTNSLSEYDKIQIGRSTDGTIPEWNGYIQDVRYTIGIARYTANFTPPTAAFPTL